MENRSVNTSGVVLPENSLSVIKLFVSPKLSIPVLISCAFGILINIITASILIKERVWQLAYRNAILLNLVIAYLLGALSFAQFGVMLTGTTGALKCIVFFHSLQWIYTTSWLSLMLQMLDQYMCIEWPLKYPIWFTPVNIKALIVCTWTLPFINFCVYKWGIDGEIFCDTSTRFDANLTAVGIYSIILLSGIPVPVTIIINIRILCIAKKRAKEVALIHIAPSSFPNTNRFQRSQGTLAQIWRSILTATIVVGSMVVTLIPFTVMTARMVFVTPTSFDAFETMVTQFCAGFAVMGSSNVINPLIVSLRVAQVKKFYANLFERFVRKCRDCCQSP